MTHSPSDPGFIRVDCKSCNNPDVWFRCDQCGKSDHFSLGESAVSCDCGASYTAGNCTCGQAVPFEQLVFVPFDKGPVTLADLEVAWGRVAALGVGVIGLIGLGAYWIWA